MLKSLLLLSLLPFCSYAEELPAPVKAIEKTRHYYHQTL